MPRLPRLPLGSLRLFARVDRFTCECPKCGQVLVATFERIGDVRRRLVQSSRPVGKNRKGTPLYNPVTQRLICHRCRRVWGIGLLIYPIAAKSMSYQPYDTAPTWQQLRAIRQLGNGTALTEPIRGTDSVNILIEHTCECVIEGSAEAPITVYSPTCPVHGWEEQLGPKTPEEQAKMAQAYEQLLDAGAFDEEEAEEEAAQQDPEGEGG